MSVRNSAFSRSAVFAVLLWIGLAQVAQAQVLRGDHMVDGDVIQLGDLFDGIGPMASQRVIPAPAPGQSVTLTAHHLQQIATAFQLTWAPIAPSQQLTLTRSEPPPVNPMLEEAIADAFATQPQLVPAALTQSQPAEIAQREPEPHRPSAQDSLVPVAVPARAITRGEVIRAGDLDVITLPADRVTPDLLVRPEDLTGMAARRTLIAGAPVREHFLQAPVIVQRDRMVTLVLETSSMTLTARGRALADAEQGALLRVENLSSGLVVEGVAERPDLVRVPFGAPVLN